MGNIQYPYVTFSLFDIQVRLPAGLRACVACDRRVRSVAGRMSYVTAVNYGAIINTQSSIMTRRAPGIPISVRKNNSKRHRLTFVIFSLF